MARVRAEAQPRRTKRSRGQRQVGKNPTAKTQAKGSVRETSSASQSTWAKAQPATFAAVSLVAIGVAEYVTTFVDPRIGVLFHMTLLICFLLAGVVLHGNQRAFALVLSSAPLIRIVSLSMPLTHWPRPLWYMLTAIPVTVGVAMIAVNLGLRPSAVGVRLPRKRYLPIEILVALSGFALGFVEWRILEVPPLVNGTSVTWIAAASVILLLFTGLFEEVIFRGFIQTVATRYLGVIPGIAFTALIFAALHIGWKSIYDLLFVFSVGVYYSIVVWKTGSILGVTISHGAINTVLFIGLPLLLVPRVLGVAPAHTGDWNFAGTNTHLVAHSVPSNIPLTLKWRKSAAATSYEVQVVSCHHCAPYYSKYKRNSLVNPFAKWPRPNWNHLAATGVVRHPVFKLKVLGPQYYWWRVRSYVPNLPWGAWQPYSSVKGFQVESPVAVVPTGIRTTFGPMWKAGVAGLMCWNRVPGAVGYRVRIDNLRTFTTNKNCVEKALPSGIYAWSVQSISKAVGSFVSKRSHVTYLWVNGMHHGIYRTPQTPGPLPHHAT